MPRPRAGHGHTVAIMNTMLPPMNPEVARIRRQGMQRRYKKALRFVRLLWLLAGVLLVALVIEIVVAMCISPRFWVYRITVSGAETLTPAEIIRLAAVPSQTNYYRAPLGAIAARLQREPRIDTSEVRRQAVGILAIHVRERAAACRIGSTQPPLYLDDAGVVFTRPIAPSSPVPVVQGFPLLDAKGKPLRSPHAMLGQRLRTQARVLQTLECLQALKDHAAIDTEPLHVSRIVFADNGMTVLVLKQGVRVFLGRPRDFAAKILVTKKTIVQAGADGYALPALDYVDVRGVEPGKVMTGVYMPRQPHPLQEATPTP